MFRVRGADKNEALVQGTVTVEPKPRETRARGKGVLFVIVSEGNFIDVMAFGDKAEEAKHLKKGQTVLVEGRLIQRKREIKKGETLRTIQVEAQKITTGRVAKGN